MRSGARSRSSRARTAQRPTPAVQNIIKNTSRHLATPTKSSEFSKPNQLKEKSSLGTENVDQRSKPSRPGHGSSVPTPNLMTSHATSSLSHKEANSKGVVSQTDEKAHGPSPPVLRTEKPTQASSPPPTQEACPTIGEPSSSLTPRTVILESKPHIDDNKQPQAPQSSPAQTQDIVGRPNQEKDNEGIPRPAPNLPIKKVKPPSRGNVDKRSLPRRTFRGRQRAIPRRTPVGQGRQSQTPQTPSASSLLGTPKRTASITKKQTDLPDNASKPGDSKNSKKIEGSGAVPQIPNSPSGLADGKEEQSARPPSNTEDVKTSEKPSTSHAPSESPPRRRRRSGRKTAPAPGRHRRLPFPDRRKQPFASKPVGEKIAQPSVPLHSRTTPPTKTISKYPVNKPSQSSNLNPSADNSNSDAKTSAPSPVKKRSEPFWSRMMRWIQVQRGETWAAKATWVDQSAFEHTEPVKYNESTGRWEIPGVQQEQDAAPPPPPPPTAKMGSSNTRGNEPTCLPLSDDNKKEESDLPCLPSHSRATPALSPMKKEGRETSKFPKSAEKKEQQQTYPANQLSPQGIATSTAGVNQLVPFHLSSKLESNTITTDSTLLEEANPPSLSSLAPEDQIHKLKSIISSLRIKIASLERSKTLNLGSKGLSTVSSLEALQANIMSSLEKNRRSIDAVRLSLLPRVGEKCDSILRHHGANDVKGKLVISFSWRFFLMFFLIFALLFGPTVDIWPDHKATHPHIMELFDNRALNPTTSLADNSFFGELNILKSVADLAFQKLPKVAWWNSQVASDSANIHTDSSEADPELKGHENLEEHSGDNIIDQFESEEEEEVVKLEEQGQYQSQESVAQEQDLESDPKKRLFNQSELAKDSNTGQLPPSEQEGEPDNVDSESAVSNLTLVDDIPKDEYHDNDHSEL